MKRRRLGKLIFRLLLLCVLLFSAALAVLVIMEKTVPPPGGEADVILILGAQVKEDGTVSVQLEGRLQAALAYWREHPDCMIVTAGGQGKNEPAPEAEVMRDWLAENGVPADRIRCESRSADTKENLRFAEEYIDKENARLLVVTSDYHLPRAIRIAKDAGYRAEGIGAPTLPQWWIKNHFREVLAWGKYFLRKII